MPGNPIRQQRQHALEIGRFRKTVVGAWENFQMFRAGQGIEESLALVQRNIFIMITLHDHGRSRDCSGRFIGDPVEAVLVEGIVEPQASGSPMKIRDCVGLFPFLQSCLPELQAKFFPEVDDRAFECEAGEWWNSRRR